MFEQLIYGASEKSRYNFRQLTARMVELLETGRPGGAYEGDSPAEIGARLARSGGGDWEADLEYLIRKSIAPWHPHTAAHLHTPVLTPAAAVELVIGALNQSMDSFDQAPSASMVEIWLMEWLTRLAGLPAEGGAVMTSGGTQSNYTGMLLARDRCIQRLWNWNAAEQGLPPEAARLRIFCSEIAHFSVEKAAAQLGLGRRAVIRVPVDARYRMRVDALAAAISESRARGEVPMAVAATLGTTDFGSIDPVEEIAAFCEPLGLWLHADAAYGGAMLLSPALRGRLRGIERADSITIDFHKAFFQPISCGAVLVKDRASFAPLRFHADYLNSEDRERDGFPDLVTCSLATTRRWDALKMWLSLRAVGESTMGEMVAALANLATETARILAARAGFEVLHEPEFGCVVFRYGDSDTLNEEIPKRLFLAGQAVVGHTRVHGRPAMKFTLNNPCVAPGDIAALLDKIERCAAGIEEAELATCK